VGGVNALEGGGPGWVNAVKTLKLGEKVGGA